MPKRLILFVEGKSDLDGAYVIVKRLLGEIRPWDSVFLDPNPFRVGGIENLTGSARQQDKWLRHLQAAGKRGNVGGILLVLDGDADRVEGTGFCAARVARTLCERARNVGAGAGFSLACVFAMQELESWLIAGIESLPGRCVDPPVTRDPETIRGAKEWLNKHMNDGYKATLHQAILAEHLDFNLVRRRNLRSFRRLESAIQRLVEAMRRDVHILTPS